GSSMGLGNWRWGIYAWVAGVGFCAPVMTAQVVPAQAVPATRPASRPAVRQAGNATPVTPSSRPTSQPVSDRLMMNFKDAPLDSVLDYLSQFGGFVVLREGPPITGPVTVLSKQPVTRQEAVAILNAALKSN